MAKQTPTTMTTGSNKVTAGTAKKIAKKGEEELIPVDLRAKIKGIATEKHPHAETGSEVECHPLMMKHLSDKGFVVYDEETTED